MVTEIRPIYFISGKNEKKSKKMMDYIGNDFIKDNNGSMNRKIAAKIRTKAQLGFLNSSASVIQSGNNFEITVKNIEQLNEVINKKAANSLGDYTNKLYQEEFSKARDVK